MKISVTVCMTQKTFFCVLIDIQTAHSFARDSKAQNPDFY